MEPKIVRTLNSSITENQIENGCYAINFCSWSRLKEHLAEAAGVPNDDVLGVIATKLGVEIIVK